MAYRFRKVGLRLNINDGGAYHDDNIAETSDIRLEHASLEWGTDKCKVRTFPKNLAMGGRTQAEPAGPVLE